MNRKDNSLSIIPGRHRLGYAIFRHQKLVYYGVISLSRFKTKAKVKQAIEGFVDKICKRFQIQRIVLKSLNKSQEISPLLKEIAQSIRVVAQSIKVKVSEFDLGFINKQFCLSNQRPTKKKTISFLISKYPELKKYQNLKKDWEKRYYGYIFQAIALGLANLNKLYNHKN